jgi:hypothetical protein
VALVLSGSRRLMLQPARRPGPKAVASGRSFGVAEDGNKAPGGSELALALRPVTRILRGRPPKDGRGNPAYMRTNPNTRKLFWQRRRSCRLTRQTGSGHADRLPRLVLVVAGDQVDADVADSEFGDVLGDRPRALPAVHSLSPCGGG